LDCAGGIAATRSACGCSRVRRRIITHATPTPTSRPHTNSATTTPIQLVVGSAAVDATATDGAEVVVVVNKPAPVVVIDVVDDVVIDVDVGEAIVVTGDKVVADTDFVVLVDVAGVVVSSAGNVSTGIVVFAVVAIVVMAAVVVATGIVVGEIVAVVQFCPAMSHPAHELKHIADDKLKQLAGSPVEVNAQIAMLGELIVGIFP